MELKRVVQMRPTPGLSVSTDKDWRQLAAGKTADRPQARTRTFAAAASGLDVVWVISLSPHSNITNNTPNPTRDTHTHIHENVYLQAPIISDDEVYRIVVAEDPIISECRTPTPSHMSGCLGNVENLLRTPTTVV